jgi:hypothetical protein
MKELLPKTLQWLVLVPNSQGVPWRKELVLRTMDLIDPATTGRDQATSTEFLSPFFNFHFSF